MLKVDNIISLWRVVIPDTVLTLIRKNNQEDSQDRVWWGVMIVFLGDFPMIINIY